MDKSPAAESLPPSLAFLKWLVIVLMITMIVGVITVVGLLVTRMPGASTEPVMPAAIRLEGGARAVAVTMHADWVAVVTDQGQILIFNHDGSLRQEVTIAP